MSSTSWNPLCFRLRKDQPKPPSDEATSVTSEDEWIFISPSDEVERDFYRPLPSPTPSDSERAVPQEPGLETKPPPNSFHAFLRSRLDGHRPLTPELFTEITFAYLRDKHGDDVIFVFHFADSPEALRKREELYLDFVCSHDFRAGTLLCFHHGAAESLLEAVGADVREVWEEEVRKYPGPIRGHSGGLESVLEMFCWNTRMLGERLGLLDEGENGIVALQPERKALIEVIHWFHEMAGAAADVEYDTFCGLRK